MGEPRDSFQWPLRPPREPGSAAELEPESSIDAGATIAGGWFRAIERSWFGLVETPLSVRLAESQWRPGRACPRCGGSVGPHEATEADGCPTCRTRRLAWSRFVRVGAYEGELAGAIRVFKYSAWTRMGHDLGAMLGERLGEAMAREQIEPAETVLVPAPMDWRRRLGRGIDHAHVLARSAGRVCGAPTERWLTRAWRPVQAAAPMSKRRANIAGAMREAASGERRARRARDRGVRLVVVVDDIRTTGATLTEACRCVRRLAATTHRTGEDRAGSRGAIAVWSAAVAVAMGPGRRTESPLSTSQAGVGDRT